jgi:hypothetical protein
MTRGDDVKIVFASTATIAVEAVTSLWGVGSGSAGSKAREYRCGRADTSAAT